MWKQSYFWLSQPSSYLVNYDNYFKWFFLIVLGFGILFKVVSILNKNEVYRKLFTKFSNIGLTIGLTGLVWFGFRYENTPVFSYRYWAALIVLGLIVWKVFLLKYMIFQFPKEKAKFQKTQINLKYMPGKK